MSSVYSVGQVNLYIKNMFTQDILLGGLSVKGEVSNCKYHSSGHIYFTLKDDVGTISVVMFAAKRTGLTFKMTDGMKVIVTGSVNVYERDGKYQIYASKIVQDGEGDLFLRFQKLKQELEEMGMFSEEYKKPIPKYSNKIGIVTASTGAAIRDIINIATRRNPYAQLVLCPAIVQGEYAAASIVRGIETLDKYGVDVIIVGRGGGSIEDLWAFNEESVARAIFECNTPVISAVGHETDFTIADFVSDLRAPTPSAAAELAVFDVRQLTGQINDYKMALERAFDRKIELLRDRISSYRLSFKFLNPINILRESRLKTADYHDRLNLIINRIIENKKHELALKAKQLEGYSPLNKIASGYAYVENEHKSVRSIQDVKTGDELNIYVSDGVVKAKVCDKIQRKPV